MKWTPLCLLLVMISFGPASGATLNLRVTWTANTEPDMKEYRLYRTDGARALIGTITHPATSYNFSVTVPDQFRSTLKFVLTAVDTNNNEGPDSSTASYKVRPGAPRNIQMK